MKGKIYKNKLSTSNQDLNNLNIQESLKNNNHHHRQHHEQNYSFSPLSQQHYKNRNQQSFIKTNQMYFNSPSKTIPINQQLSLCQKVDKSLKKVISNPNLTYNLNSYQELISENRQDEEENSIFNNSARSQFVNNLKGNKINANGNANGLFSKTASQFNHMDFSKAINTTKLTPTEIIQNQLHYFETIPKTRSNPPQQTLNLQYISQYEKRHKQRMETMYNQHQIQVESLHEEIKNKDDIISELKRILKEKEEMIKRLTEENSNLSSRSYVSFANYNVGNQQEE